MQQKVPASCNEPLHCLYSPLLRAESHFAFCSLVIVIPASHSGLITANWSIFIPLAGYMPGSRQPRTAAARSGACLRAVQVLTGDCGAAPCRAGGAVGRP